MKTAPPSRGHALAGPRAALALAGLALLSAAASIALQGYAFGTGNQVFYVAYVLRLPALPQFASDPFYATLANFTTVVWPLLRLVSNDGNVETVFFAAHAATRAVEFAAFLWALSCLGVRRDGLVLASIVLALSALFQGDSFVGRHGLFLDYFTHTEVATPLVLAAFVCAARDKPILAFAAAGIAFDVNAFVGIWLAVALAAGWLARNLDEYRLAPTKALRDLAAVSLAYLLTALPVAIWIASTLRGGGADDFDYVHYLREYYPYHFIVDASSPAALLHLATMTTVTTFLLVRTKFDRFWLWSYLALAGLFLAGTALPYVFGSRLLLNLHLLRVDGTLQLLSTVFALAFALRELPKSMRVADLTTAQLAVLAALATADWYIIAAVLAFLLAPPGAMRLRVVYIACLILAVASARAALASWLGETPHAWLAAAVLVAVAGASVLSVPEAVGATLIGLLAAASVLLPGGSRGGLSALLPVGVAAVTFAVAATRKLPSLSVIGHLPVSLLVLLLVAPSALKAAHVRAVMKVQDANETAQWRDIVSWVRDHPGQGPYIGPSVPARQAMEPDLQLFARVPVWVDWKRGGAVMWSPAYYSTWGPRLRALQRATTPQALYELACRQRIPNVIVERGFATNMPSASVRYSNPGFEVLELDLPCNDVPSG